MPLDRTWLLGVARHERDGFGRTVQYTPPDRWELPTQLGDWRAKDVLAHLSSSEVAIASVLNEEPPAEFEAYLKESGARPSSLDEFMNGFNASTVAKRADSTPRSLALEWGNAADLWLARASRFADDDWGRNVTWAVEEIPRHAIVQSRVAEWWVHGEDIRAAVGLPTRLEHEPIFVINDYAVRQLTFRLGQEGLSFPGRSVQIDLDGPGEGSWRRGLSRGYRPDPKGEPDAYIEGRGIAFALVAARRVDPDLYLYDGDLQVGGDVDLARTVLRNLRYGA